MLCRNGDIRKKRYLAVNFEGSFHPFNMRISRKEKIYVCNFKFSTIYYSLIEIGDTQFPNLPCEKRIYLLLTKLLLDIA